MFYRNVAYTLFQFFVWNSFVRGYSWLTMLIIRGYMLKTFEDKWTKKKDESKHVIEGYPQFSAGDHRGVIWLRKSIKSEKLQFSPNAQNNLLIGSLVDKILCFLDKNYWVIFRLKVLNLNFLQNFVLLRWQLWRLVIRWKRATFLHTKLIFRRPPYDLNHCNQILIIKGYIWTVFSI